MALHPLSWLLHLAVLCPLVLLLAGQQHASNKCSNACGVMTKEIPRDRLASYQRTEPSCRKRAIILTTRKNRTFCADPKERWVQEAMEYLDRKAGPSSEKLTGPIIAPAITGTTKTTTTTAASWQSSYQPRVDHWAEGKASEAASSQAPPTQASSTQAPSTQAPATQAPTQALPTDLPSTQAPSTQAPATQAPTQALPTDLPSTQAPSTQAPATQAPTQALPTDLPSTQAPSTQAPSTQALPTDLPSTQAPPTQASSTQAPSTQALPTDPPSTQPPSTQALPTDPPSSQAPPTQAPSTQASLTQALPTKAGSIQNPHTDTPSSPSPSPQAASPQAPAISHTAPDPGQDLTPPESPLGSGPAHPDAVTGPGGSRPRASEAPSKEQESSDHQRQDDLATPEATRRQAVGLLAFLGLLFCLGVATLTYQRLQGCPRGAVGDMVEGLRYVPRSCGSNSYVLVPV